ncbi:MAG: L,D-transpeptidase [Acetobacteraceae bacterium]|nr:L,D-transpeptidase [Acetobacteraceae bacterium]
MNGLARFGFTLVLCLLLLLTSCTSPSPQAVAPQITQSPQVVTTDPRVPAEIALLRNALAQAVPQNGTCSTVDKATWIAPAQAALVAAGMTIDRPQLLVVVDRNPGRQGLCLIVTRTDAAWQAIGGSKVSTGQAGRHGYYITPTGVFVHSDAILDYRALGTFNENHIRGLGLKGMRVWDFGWQQAEKGWTPDLQYGEIRLLIHATDPDYLERRLGRPASQGCVRIPATMNRFLDQYGVLDADYERAALTDARFAAIAPPDRQSTPLAGNMMVVIDSAAGT